MSLGEGVQFDFPLLHGADLGLAGIDLVRLAARLINRLEAGLFHFCSISFAERICKTVPPTFGKVI
jgi:hypothetical protein